jgi:hypothetical protein
MWLLCCLSFKSEILLSPLYLYYFVPELVVYSFFFKPSVHILFLVFVFVLFFCLSFFFKIKMIILLIF